MTFRNAVIALCFVSLPAGAACFREMDAKTSRFSADGKHLYLTGNFHLVTLDGVTAEGLKAVETDLISDTDGFSANAKYAAFMEWQNGDIKIFETATGKETSSFRVKGWRLGLTPSDDGKTLLASEWAKGKPTPVHAYETTRGKVLYSFTPDHIAVYLQFMADGKILTAERVKRFAMSVYDPATEKIEKLKTPDKTDENHGVAVNRKGEFFVGERRSALSEDGTLVAESFEGNPVRVEVRDVKTKKVFVNESGRKDDTLSSVAFSPDGKRVAISWWPGTGTCIFDVKR